MKREEILVLLNKKKEELGLYYYLLVILYSSGARISEVLEIKAKDLIPFTDIIIKGKKGSRNRRVSVYGCEVYIKHCITHSLDPFSMISRFQVYRMIKRLGLSIENGPNKKASVTHGARKLYIRESFKSGADIRVVADTIGHNSTKSTKYYE